MADMKDVATNWEALIRAIFHHENWHTALVNVGYFDSRHGRPVKVAVEIDGKILHFPNIHDAVRNIGGNATTFWYALRNGGKYHGYNIWEDNENDTSEIGTNSK